MTRVNVGYPPRKLPWKQLFAEYREIKRIPNMVKSGRANLSSIPEFFCLGPGHVRFFYNKLGYLKKRFTLVRAAVLAHPQRKGSITDFSSAWDGVPKELMNDYIPTAHDCKIIRDRVRERTHKDK